MLDLRILKLIAVVIGAFLSVTAALGRPLALDDIYALQSVAEPQISPDGDWVAYSVTVSNREEDESNSDIWMASWDGAQSLPLTTSAEASESLPRWSPDGKLLAFLSDRSDKADTEKKDQIWVLDRRGGEARKLTDLPDGVSDFAWSPDGKRMVLVAEVIPDEEKEPDEKSDEKPRPIVIDRYLFKFDGQGYLRGERSHLYLLDLDTRKVTALTSGLYNEETPSWSPDGSAIAFISKRGEDIDRHNNWDVYLIEPRAGAVARKLTTNPGTDGDPVMDFGGNGVPPDWSPDSSRIAYLHGGPPKEIWYGLFEVGVIAANGSGDATPTRGLDRNTSAPQWSRDGQSVYFMLEDDQSVQLARVRLRDGRVERLTPPGRTVTEFDIGPKGRVAVVSSTADHPAEVAALESGKLRALSHQNDAWLKDVPLAPAESIEFKSADGKSIHAVLLKPAGYRAGEKVPTLLDIHGGPVSQNQHDFYFEWQLLAGAGYAVVAPNPRGSSGRGFEFQRALWAQWGYADVPDVLAAVDHVVASGIADPNRLGVGGWSYGAILTNYVIASDKRFKAATSGAGMSNMLAGYGTDEYVVGWEAELGLPWTNTDTWTRLSYPFLHADRISTPTLFLCGEDDFNVPLLNSEQMYQALRSLGVPTKLVIYPGETHSLDRPSFRRDRLERYLDWYGRYVKDAKPGA